MGQPTAGRRPGTIASNIGVALGCVLFLGGFVWGALLYRPYTVPTNSMSPTVAAGDRVLAERISADEIRRGDVVVFKDVLWGNAPEVKRVVGIGGDEVACCDDKGRLTVNGKPVEEPYLRDKGLGAFQPFSTTVEQGRLFLLGDHRSTSVDSRNRLTDQAQGSISADSVQARVDATAWPLGEARMLPRATGFAGLPGGVSTPGPVKPLVAAVIVGAVLILGGAAYGPVAARLRRRRAD
ncbi:signal peptidase I [Streptomyces sp. NPDC051940]|uniref:signal peptidase I n=1 Tax=Streptomyces sp. NPDC051940 TaxID=3155675 RepID=UPI003440C57B